MGLPRISKDEGPAVVYSMKVAPSWLEAIKRLGLRQEIRRAIGRIVARRTAEEGPVNANPTKKR